MSDKLIAALRKAKDTSADSLKRISHELNLPISQVAGVASFYSTFTGAFDGTVDTRFALGGKEGTMFAPANYGKILEFCRENTDIIDSLRASGLVGRGGAGFPIAEKWELTKNAAGEKLIICNGSEGEGETFKDMKLMLRAPHAIIQGMMLCAAAIGSTKGYIYVRAEYPECAESMNQALAQAPLGDFTIEIILGAGAYVCGEETALIRSLQGQRGEPTLKPPYPGVKGLNGQPTVINNAESFAAASAYFLTGNVSKLFTISGCVDAPGVYELPYGMTVKEVADLAGAKNIKGFRLGGGCTGRIFNAKSMDLVLDPKAGLGTASLFFFDDKTDVRALCAKSVGFLAKQSCGKCVPCRYGSEELEKLLREQGDTIELEKLCNYLKLSSRCALGQGIPNTVESAMAAFPAEFTREGGGNHEKHQNQRNSNCRRTGHDDSCRRPRQWNTYPHSLLSERYLCRQSLPRLCSGSDGQQ